MRLLMPAKVIDWILQHQPVALTTHITPDGDGLGAEAALYHYLKSQGVAVFIYNDHQIPDKFSLLNHDGAFLSIIEKHPMPAKPKGVIVLDTHEWARTGEASKQFEALGFSAHSDHVLYVDHHVLEPGNHLGYIREEACATGELVFDIIEEWQKKIKKPVGNMGEKAALGVYVSLVTDTGGFQFRRTTKRTHEMAGLCLQSGVKPFEVYQCIYGSGTFAKLLFEAEVLSRAQLTPCKRLLFIQVPLSLREKYAITVEDTQGLVGKLRAVGNVEVCMMAREESDGVKFSLRSNSDTEIVGIAQKFGGGGHRHAAGMKIEMEFHAAVPFMVNEVLNYLGQKMAS